MHKALRASPAHVRVLGMSKSRFIAKRGSKPSGSVEWSQPLYESVLGSMRMVPSEPHAWILRKELGPHLDYPFSTHQASLLTHRGKHGSAHLPSSPWKGCARESTTKRQDDPQTDLYIKQRLGGSSHTGMMNGRKSHEKRPSDQMRS
jgi:hypothetical protein